MGTVVIEQANGLHENWEGSRARRDMGEATARSEDGDAPLAECVASYGGVGTSKGVGSASGEAVVEEYVLAKPVCQDETTKRQVLVPKGILGETVRGAGQGASPWKSVKFEEELPEGFPERTANASRRRVARQSELSGTRLVILILACLWLSRVFHILTRRIAQSLTGGARDEF